MNNNGTNNSTQPSADERRQLIAALASTISAEQQAWNKAQWDSVLAWNAQEQKKKTDKTG